MSRRLRTQARIREELPEILREKGISYRQIAAATGFSQSYLSRVLGAEQPRSPSMKFLEAVSTELGLPVDYFADYREQAVITAIKDDERLRDRIFDSLSRRNEI